MGIGLEYRKSKQVRCNFIGKKVEKPVKGKDDNLYKEIPGGFEP